MNPAALPAEVRIVEVGPRDGLQNEPETLSTADKLEFVRRLAAAGLRSIEATSFVHPRAVPQLADAAEVAAGLPAAAGVTFSALVPNRMGFERAAAAGLRRVALFTAASDTFAQRNINMSVEDSLQVFGEVAGAARAAGISVRSYVSTAFVCPFEGEIGRERVRDITLRLLDLGVDEVAISDTIGVAAPTDIHETVGHLLKDIPASALALHLHDTCGTALANVCAGLQLGISTFDASTGGLGGCPYAPGAAGNLATEDLVYMLERMGIHTGVDLSKIIDAARFISRVLGRPLHSRQFRRLGPMPD